MFNCSARVFARSNDNAEGMSAPTFISVPPCDEMLVTPINTNKNRPREVYSMVEDRFVMETPRKTKNMTGSFEIYNDNKGFDDTNKDQSILANDLKYYTAAIEIDNSCFEIHYKKESVAYNDEHFEWETPLRCDQQIGCFANLSRRFGDQIRRSIATTISCNQPSPIHAKELFPSPSKSNWL
jgi:hypothetical protein